jgi:hypothetical protein
VNVDHRAEAEKHLANAAYHLTEDPGDMRIAEVAAWIGQGHANLVRNEEQAATTADLRDAITLLRRREHATREAVSQHIAKGLASREKARWSAARSLAQALDEAHNNVDDLIDARLSDDGYDTKLPWTFPAPVASGDPWAATPDITADVPVPVRRVIAGHLAEALLGGQSEDVRQWARGITFELKRVGADLAPDIEARIRNLTLGYDPSAPPF